VIGTYAATSYAADAITPREVEIYGDVFMQEVNTLIPEAIHSVFDPKKFVFIDLPTEKFATTLEMSVAGSDKIHFTVREFADYIQLDDIRPVKIIAKVKELAAVAAESYVSNVKNAFIEGGRLRGMTKLYLNRWDDFRVNVVRNSTGIDPESSPYLGWAAFRYRFVAGKI
jgi:hypothetical protein